MDDINRNHEDETESTPLDSAPVESDSVPDGILEDIAPEEAESLDTEPEEAEPQEAEPEEAEFEENDDFELGITIEEMKGEEPVEGSERSVRMEESAVGDAGDASAESTPSDHGDQPDFPGAQAFFDRPESVPLLSAIAGIHKKMGERFDQLADLFETKIKVDTHKNKVIDNLHNELQTFRDGIIKKQFYSFVTDMIKVIDDVRKFKRHYDGMPPTAENMESILNFLEGITSDIEDLFSWQGVDSFCCGEAILDTSRQRVIKKIECDDPAMDKMVAESLRPGYEWDGKVIRPEMVSIYMHVNNNSQEDTLADGQTD